MYARTIYYLYWVFHLRLYRVYLLWEHFLIELLLKTYFVWLFLCSNVVVNSQPEENIFYQCLEVNQIKKNFCVLSFYKFAFDFAFAFNTLLFNGQCGGYVTFSCIPGKMCLQIYFFLLYLIKIFREYPAKHRHY